MIWKNITNISQCKNFLTFIHYIHDLPWLSFIIKYHNKYIRYIIHAYSKGTFYIYFILICETSYRNITSRNMQKYVQYKISQNTEWTKYLTSNLHTIYLLPRYIWPNIFFMHFMCLSEVNRKMMLDWE